MRSEAWATSSGAGILPPPHCSSYLHVIYTNLHPHIATDADDGGAEAEVYEA